MFRFNFDYISYIYFPLCSRYWADVDMKSSVKTQGGAAALEMLLLLLKRNLNPLYSVNVIPHTSLFKMYKLEEKNRLDESNPCTIVTMGEELEKYWF